MDPEVTLDLLRDDTAHAIDRDHAALDLLAWLADGGWAPEASARREAEQWLRNALDDLQERRSR